MNKKLNLRKKAKEIRKNLDIVNISKNLVNKIQQNSIYQKSNNVLIYYPIKTEPNLLGLLNDNKKFYFPKVKDKELLVCPYSSECKFGTSKFNIKEPCNEAVSPNLLDLVIVPALMIDAQGFRLGYGGGFYDRFLSKYNIQTLCAIPKELIVETLPTEEFDVPIDIIITDI